MESVERLKRRQSVIVLGADGFIGKKLVLKLQAQNIFVYAMVLHESPAIKYFESLSGITVLEADYSEWTLLVDKLPIEPLAVINLAWLGVRPEDRNNIEKQRINIDICFAAVNMAIKLKAQKVIMPGSTLEYCYGNNEPINEKSFINPIDAYGSVKVATRFLCKSMCSQYKIPFIYLVLASIYSEDRIDNNVITYTIKELLDGRRPVYTSLQQYWDYIHIDDVIDAICLVISKADHDAFYCIGTGEQRKLLDYIEYIRDIIAPNQELGIGEKPFLTSTIPYSCVDIEAIKKELGYIPKVSFDVGIHRVINKIKALKETE